MFAFITSFDELLIALFLSGTGAVTLPRRMFDEIRYDIDPTIAAVSSLLILPTTTLMLAAELMRRRSRAPPDAARRPHRFRPAARDRDLNRKERRHDGPDRPAASPAWRPSRRMSPT